MELFARTFFGSLFGAFGFCALIGGLDETFRPYPNDMSDWILYALPAGILLGGLTAFVLALSIQGNLKRASRTSLVAACLLLPIHIALFVPTKEVHFSFIYWLSQAGPGFVWLFVLAMLGFRWQKASKKLPI